MNNKTALVLGCSGQDGSLISHSLIRKGYRVVGLSRKASSHYSNFQKLGIENEIQVVEGDIRNFISIRKLIEYFKPEEIYNLAGQSSVGKSFIAPFETTESIFNGTLNLLEAARITNFTGKIFFAGSSEIFGETEKGAEINSPQNPLSPYAIGKQSSFNLVKFYREVYGINCMTGILFNHESPLRASTFVTQKIITGVITCSRNKTTKLKLGNLDIARDWGWAEEYVEAMQLITNAAVITDQIICTGRLTKLTDFLAISSKKFNLNWNDYVISDETLVRKTDIKKSFGNPSILKQDLGWLSHITLEEMIEKLIEDKMKNMLNDY